MEVSYRARGEGEVTESDQTRARAWLPFRAAFVPERSHFVVPRVEG